MANLIELEKTNRAKGDADKVRKAYALMTKTYNLLDETVYIESQRVEECLTALANHGQAILRTAIDVETDPLGYYREPNKGETK